MSEENEAHAAEAMQGGVPFTPVLCRASCGHMTVRNLAGPIESIDGPQLANWDQLWDMIPCQHCVFPYSLQVLDRATELLHSGWTRKGYLAEKRLEYPTSGLDEKATKWSLLGALQRARMDCHGRKFFQPMADPIIGQLMVGFGFHLTGIHIDVTDVADALVEWQMEPGRKVTEVLDAAPRVRADVLTIQATFQAAQARQHEQEALELGRDFLADIPGVGEAIVEGSTIRVVGPTGVEHVSADGIAAFIARAFQDGHRDGSDEG